MKIKIWLIYLINIIFFYNIISTYKYANESITLIRLSINFKNPVGIDYHELSNTVIVSANYPKGYPYNFELINFAGTYSPFAPDIVNLTHEIYIATVRTKTYQLQNGWQIGELYTGNGIGGQVTKISSNGTSFNRTWVNLQPYGYESGWYGLLRGGLLFDETGALSGDLLVLDQQGHVARIDSTGNAHVFTIPASLRGTTPSGCWPWHTEGMVVVPNNATRYGGLAGKIVVGAQYSLQMYIIDPTKGNVTAYNVPMEIEDFLLVPPDENFFIVAYASQEIFGSKASDWTNLVGEILLFEEPICHPLASPSGMWLLRWENDGPEFLILPFSSNSDEPGSKSYEDATFAPVGILELPPVDPICIYLTTSQNSNEKINLTAPFTIPSPLNAIDYYSYNYPNPDASHFNLIPNSSLSDALTIFFTIDYQNLISLFISVGSPDSENGGKLSLNINAPNLQVSVTQLQQQDDPATGLGTPSTSAHTDYVDSYIYQDGGASFSWKWGHGTGDGAVISPLDIFGSTGGICLTFSIISSENITKWQFVYPDLQGNPQFTYVGLNETATVCIYNCKQFCFLFKDCADCDSYPECQWCASSSPPVCQQSNDQCSNAYVNNSCPCKDYSTCSSCYKNSKCGWCCASNQCQLKNETSCNNWESSNCGRNESGKCGKGQFICGNCSCPLGYGGPYCNETYDCQHVLGGHATIDVCGVCGGNGSECMGCNGKPFGPKLDACGYCGFNSSCNLNNCTTMDCMTCFHDGGEYCFWCPKLNKCFFRTDFNACTGPEGTISDCPHGLTPAEIAGISAGAIAGAAIGAAAGVGLLGYGGKKGYDYYKARKGPLTGATNNPLYSDNGRTGTNPFYNG